jgi:hypothetical protein
MQLANRPFSSLLTQFKLLNRYVFYRCCKGLTVGTKERRLANKVEDMAATPHLATITFKTVLSSDIAHRLLIGRGVISCEVTEPVLEAILSDNIAHRLSNSEAAMSSFLA